ncbi:SH3 domain-containing protein, partial [Clostridioides difficile]
YSLVGKANNGDVVKLLEQSNGWYKIIIFIKFTYAQNH